MTTKAPVIRLRNSLSRKLEAFEPHDMQDVRMYVCGPTVYDRAHLGNARPVVVFDVLYRLLRHVYGADHVTYVRNFTDVDDKINAEALRRQKAGATGTLEELIRSRTEETIGWYHADMDALGALRPDHEPRATEWIGAMIAMIEGLIARGHAYEAEGHVLFRVRSYADYGALSGRSVDDMIAGARVEVAPFKEDPLDFVLWKPSDGELPGWDSPWGRGRPGWHIECSAMSRELLGESFDIHGGGIDLQFPHHENEIAQSRCAHPEEGFARYWLHNEMVMVDGKKMSKSLGNFFTVRDLLDQGVPGEVIRYVFLMTHYRSPMDWTEEKVQQALRDLRDWASVAQGEDPGLIDEEMILALADDLNISEAIRVLRDLYRSKEYADLKASALMLGFDLQDIARQNWAQSFEYTTEDGVILREGEDYMPTVSVSGWGRIDDDVRDAALAMVHRWLGFRRNKDFDAADRLRSAASEAGVELRATRSPNGISQGLAQLNRADITVSELDAIK